MPHKSTFSFQISEDGKKVVGWDAYWDPSRPFAMDMAGFAVNLGLFLSRPKAKFAYRVKRGLQGGINVFEIFENHNEVDFPI